ncbi:hypothetical protein [Aureibacter tunicatorum]|uniref:Uncharacterized protein n=1 Tax=Aureibacter tunicatorum TaxID=866807 RepID=A0AAE3XQU0_9BACT|nr:hypothetical protein [Aureibacter tunicatorum]MDR6240965.1 hypothetical protein [Aureibacter tunicatorum]BDD03745.1 hypothetical protein AUTU_12280 [Aureibacter tunicatorum]
MIATTTFQDIASVKFLKHDSIKEQLSVKLQDAIDDRRIKLKDSSVYMRRNIRGLSGDNELIEPNDNFDYGVRNIAYQKLPLGEALVAKGLLVGFSKTANDGETDLKKVKYSNVLSDDIPAELLNADLIVSVDGTSIFEERIGLLLMQTKSEQPVREAIYKFSNWNIFPDDKKINVKIKFHDKMPDDANYFFETSFIGDYTRIK